MIERTNFCIEYLNKSIIYTNLFTNTLRLHLLRLNKNNTPTTT